MKNHIDEEIYYHELLLESILKYKTADGICEVSQSVIAKEIHKNKTWVQKAIHRLNAEDTCIEMIKKGTYKIHYTNIRERGVFPKILMLIEEKKYNPDFTESDILLTEKYHVTKKTVAIFTGFCSLLLKDIPR